ncbi:MAG: hypothetical protein EPN91_11955 [Salinibacterium sp.]|nr:MAG: hypothetical protein EPN91_11955 [Salinibacterium sp.]
MKTLLALSAATMLIMLTGCTPGAGTGAPSATGADCVVGSWTADLDDLATQLADFFTSTGFGDDLTGTATGTEHATFNSNRTTTTSDDATFVFMGHRAGKELTLTQVHSGGFSSDWDFVDGTFDFSNFDAPHYSITSTVKFDGHTTTLPVSTTEGFAEDIPIETSCHGDIMTMKPENSPFTTTWHRD